MALVGKRAISGTPPKITALQATSNFGLPTKNGSLGPPKNVGGVTPRSSTTSRLKLHGPLAMGLGGPQCTGPDSIQPLKWEA